MPTPVSLQHDGDVALIIVDNPPVNALSQAVRSGLLDCLLQADAERRCRAIVLACAGRTFIAGADIAEFGRPPQPPSLREVIAAFDAAAKPIVAAIHGTALGGGLELALACHYRCAERDAELGFPEVRLGLLPGAGGTQRLPRAIGIAAALKLIVSGERIPAERARELGAIDTIAIGDLRDRAVALARRAAGEQWRDRVLSRRSVAKDLPQDFFAAERERIAARVPGLQAPQRCIDAVEATLRLPFEQGLRFERELFEACLASTESRAQRYLFFGERSVRRVPGLNDDVRPRPLARVAIVGAGTMGGGIALACAAGGLDVRLYDRDPAALARADDGFRRHYESAAARGRLEPAAARRQRALIRSAADLAALGGADLYVEAVFEDLGLKQQVFAELDRLAGPGAILATNTSSLDVDRIAAATGRPESVLGLHFFSPAQVMRLLEVVRGGATADDVLLTGMELARRLGKIGVVAGVCPGFIGNRMLAGYLREAYSLLLEGVPPACIDAALREFGFPMGPFTMIDMAGIDVNYRVRHADRSAAPADVFAIEDRLFELGRYGQKTGAGWYRYAPGSREPQPDPEIDALAVSEAARLGIERRASEGEVIVDRCILPLVHEAARILEEGIAYGPIDIDVVWVTGYGFPRHRGGPLFYADSRGLEAILSRSAELADASPHPALWAPAPLLRQLAAEGRDFDSLGRGER